ncbi:MAG: DUF4212 domain-containing protein [Planctomycetota bacterium]
MPDSVDPVRRAKQRYWRANVAIMTLLLMVWAVVGLGCGVLWADVLNDAGQIGGVPLGFWFAQQGSIATFVVIIFVYALAMNRLDARYHHSLETLRHPPGPGPTAPPASLTSGSNATEQGGDA